MCWFLIVDVLLLTLSLAEGQSGVVGSSKIITAAPGDDVILPCLVEPALNVETLTVEWSKPDLKPDPSDPLKRVNYVHLYRNRIEVTDMKLASYANRTRMFTEELKHGNISLKILNVTLEDTGRYRCFIPKLNSNVRDSIVELNVDLKSSTPQTPLEPADQSPADPTDMTNVEGTGSKPHILIIPPIVGLLLLIAVTAWCLLQKRRKNRYF